MNTNNSHSLSELQAILGIKFKNETILKEALIHRSFSNALTSKDKTNNERLEFLGDAVLELAVTKMLFNKFPSLPEGKLTSYRSSLVRTQSLADEALKLNLGKYILMNSGEERTGGRNRPYILANTFEAIIGAIYLDSGLDAAETFIHKNVFLKIDGIVKTHADEDPKSKLQEISQEKFKITPKYELIKAIGPDHNKKFWMAAYIGNAIVGEGEGESKQTAEQGAADQALKNWNKIRALIRKTNDVK